MSIIATAVKHLMDAGVTGDALLRAIEEMEAELGNMPKPKSSAAIRQQRYRDNKRNEASQTVTNNACDAESPLDKKSPHTPKKIKPLSPPIVPPFALKFVETWNEVAAPAGLPKARELSHDRRAKLKRRVSEFSEDEMLQAIRSLAGSRFHCGENDRGWTADIGWLIRSAENVTKVLELGERQSRSRAEPVDFMSHLSARRSTG